MDLLWRTQETDRWVCSWPGRLQGMPCPISLGPPASLRQTQHRCWWCWYFSLLPLLFLLLLPASSSSSPSSSSLSPPPPPPPPPLPAVAKLHQKTPLLCVNCSISTICQVEGSHPAGSSRMPPREKHNLLAGSLAPRAYLGTPVYAPQPQSHVLKHTAALGRVLACGSTLLTLLGQGLQIPLPPLPRPMTPESCRSL